jgi:hypothetical protein
LLHDGDLCADHDTAEIRAMSRSHAYVFDGRRVVLESRPWDAWVDDIDGRPTPVVHTLAESAQKAAPAPSVRHMPVDEKQAARAALVHPGTARPCWEWCGRPGPAPRCHPASRFSPAPTFPCLACGREIYACQSIGLCCLGACTEFSRDRRALLPADVAARWLSPDEIEAWRERAAIIAESMPLAMAEQRALGMAWRARVPAQTQDRTRLDVGRLDVAAKEAAPAPPPSPAPVAPGRLVITDHTPASAASGQAQLAFFGW